MLLILFRFNFFQLSPTINPPAALCNDSRRFWFVIIALLLTLATTSSVVMVIFIHEDCLKLRPTHDYTNASYLSRDNSIFLTKYENAKSAYAVGMVIMCVCTILNVGVVGMWLFAECVMWPGERKLARYEELLSIRALVQNVGASRS